MNLNKIMKKAITLFFSLLLVLSLCCVQSPSIGKVEAASIKLSKTKVILAVRQTTTLSVKNTKKSVSWKSSDSSVVTVKKGKLTAKKVGDATVTATVGSKNLTCEVHVRGDYKVLYKQLLESGKNSSGDIAGFIRMDINKDGVPELITADAISGGRSNREIYTVRGGKLVNCGNYFQNGSNYFSYNSKYKSVHYWWWTNGVGGAGDILYKISGGKLTSYKYFWSGAKSYGSEKIVYNYGTSYKKSKSISKSKFNSLEDKYLKYNKSYKFIANTSANRIKYFGN
ncbi:MAG: Ig-like domain-containing protein [Lachnospiraceae bacterium]|nr:Ig-like domain-containing protein [Lachnospiraceae bacterium]